MMLRHLQIRNTRIKLSLVFTAIVCWCLRAADTSLSVGFRPKSTAVPGALQVDNELGNKDPNEIDLSQVAEKATFRKSLPFPFEAVHETWENGEPDHNLLREDIEIRHAGTEEIKKKFIYTRNPLPFLLRKTVFRLEEFIFEEEQSIDLRQRFSKAWSENRVFEGLIKARRTFHLKADPNNKGWSVLEQTLAVSASRGLGNTVKRQLEKIALSMFLNTCETSSGQLHDNVAKKQAELTESMNRLIESIEVDRNLDSGIDPVEPQQLTQSHPKQPRGLRKMAEVVVSRGIILAGAALRVWAILKSSHQANETQKELAPQECAVRPTEGVTAEQQEHAKLRGKLDPFKQQQTPQQQQDDGRPHMAILRNPIKRMMSVAAAAFVSV